MFACLLDVRPGCTSCMAPGFLHNKGNHKIVPKKVYPLHCGASFLLVSFHLQIAYRKVVN